MSDNISQDQWDNEQVDEIFKSFYRRRPGDPDPPKREFDKGDPVEMKVVTYTTDSNGKKHKDEKYEKFTIQDYIEFEISPTNRTPEWRYQLRKDGREYKDGEYFRERDLEAGDVEEDD